MFVWMGRFYAAVTGNLSGLKQEFVFHLHYVSLRLAGVMQVFPPSRGTQPVRMLLDSEAVGRKVLESTPTCLLLFH